MADFWPSFGASPTLPLPPLLLLLLLPPPSPPSSFSSSPSFWSDFQVGSCLPVRYSGSSVPSLYLLPVKVVTTLPSAAPSGPSMPDVVTTSPSRYRGWWLMTPTTLPLAWTSQSSRTGRGEGASSPEASSVGGGLLLPPWTSCRAVPRSAMGRAVPGAVTSAPGPALASVSLSVSV